MIGIVMMNSLNNNKTYQKYKIMHLLHKRVEMMKDFKSHNVQIKKEDLLFMKHSKNNLLQINKMNLKVKI
jgi:hypothetical protein